MKRFATLILTLCCILVSSCYHDDPPYEGEYSDVFIYYGMGYNNLSANLASNIADLCSGILPGKSREKAILAFTHNPRSYGDYNNSNPPLLLRIHRQEGKMAIDTLKIYEEMKYSASGESLRQVLTEIREMFPSKSYGLLVSSHGTGWIPPGYKSSTESVALSAEAAAFDYSQFPATKSIGSQYEGSYRNNQEIELKEFADAIPMKLDYMILDACLMGGVEVAWELKDVCDKLIFSPTEILSEGMRYKNMSWHLFSGERANLEAICKEYYEYYNSLSGTSCSASISLVDCTKLDGLASAYAGIIENHRDALTRINRNNVQRYFYDNKSWFYDLRDGALMMGASKEELGKLDAALDECVEYHAETEFFFNIKLENCCGLSSYLPDSRRASLNNYYKTLSWNQAVGLVK